MLSWRSPAQDTWAKSLATMCVVFAKWRLKTCMWHLEGFGSTALLLSDRNDARTHGLQKLQELSAALEWARNQDSVTIAEQVEESFASSPVFEWLLQQLKIVTFSVVPNNVRDALLHAFSVGQTKVIEDAHQRMRAAEDREQPNKTVKMARVWQIPIQTQVASGVHRFPEIDFRKAHHYITKAERFNGRMCTPSSTKPKTDLKGIISHGDATWTSKTPAALAAGFADAAVWKHCMNNPGEAPLATCSYLAEFMAPGTLVRRTGQRCSCNAISF